MIDPPPGGRLFLTALLFHHVQGARWARPPFTELAR